MAFTNSFAKRGHDGRSAYELALMDGFSGTEKEWEESLHDKVDLSDFVAKDQLISMDKDEKLKAILDKKISGQATSTDEDAYVTSVLNKVPDVTTALALLTPGVKSEIADMVTKDMLNIYTPKANMLSDVQAIKQKNAAAATDCVMSTAGEDAYLKDKQVIVVDSWDPTTKILKLKTYGEA